MKNSKLKGINENLEKESFLSAKKRAYVILRELKKYVDTSWPSNILDLGCGNGDFLIQFPRVKKYGVEFSEQFADKAREKGIEVYVHDLNEGLPKFSIKFDLIFAVEILEHLIDGMNLLTEIPQYLNPGGLFMVSAPNDLGYLPRKFHIFFKNSIFHSEEIYKEPHIRFFNLKILDYYLKKIGLKVIKKTGYNLDERARYFPLGRSLISALAKISPTLFATNFLVIAKK